MMPSLSGPAKVLPAHGDVPPSQVPANTVFLCFCGMYVSAVANTKVFAGAGTRGNWRQRSMGRRSAAAPGGLDRRLGDLGPAQVGWWSSLPKVALIANIWSPFGRKPLTSGPQIIQRRVHLFELLLMCLQSFFMTVIASRSVVCLSLQKRHSGFLHVFALSVETELEGCREMGAEGVLR